MTRPADERVLERFLEKRRRQHERGQQYRSYLTWSGRALEAPVSVVVGLLLGRLLDGSVPAIAPWGTWAGLGFGLAAAVRALYRLVKAYQREDARADAASSEERP
ncbi:MAG: AtpZ/AtpI family protein [Deltaproteobacteria bacterium]|nr:AtpZ/AtpI family protein [Deltaproteobacteria bacterium]